ncbi:MAG: transglutaminase domain-containing protein [Spirochaetales bacterium]|nr:transglutaminase domain-containing protein [Spirochaetales bacterium]
MKMKYIVMKILVLIFLFSGFSVLWGEDDDSIPGIWVRKNPKTYHVGFTVYRTGTKPVRITKGILKQLFIMPLPKTDRYHVVKNVITPRNSDILSFSPGGDLYVRAKTEGIPDETTVAYDITLYDITIDYSKIKTIYNFNKNSPIWANYTKKESDRLDPEQPEIVKIAKELKSGSKDFLDFARKAYQYLQKNFRYTLNGKTDSIADIINNGGGECGALSSLYVSILRSAGIPARQLVGGLVNDKGKWGPHIWSEFYLEKYGWIPADPAAWTGDPEGWFGYMSSSHMAFNIRREGTFDVITTKKQTAGLQNFYWWIYQDTSTLDGKLNYDYRVSCREISTSEDDSDTLNPWEGFSRDDDTDQVDMTGIWETEWGGTDVIRMTLKQNGNSVTGVYSYKNGKIQGKIKTAKGKTVLEGTWTQSDGTGWFLFTLSRDGDRFTGLWGYSKPESSGHWNGSRK